MVIAVFTHLILITYITSDYFLWEQLGATKNALNQSQGDNAASISAQKEIAQNRTRVKSQENFSAASKSASQQFADTIKQMQSQTRAPKTAADAAKNAADTANATAKLVQRPWVRG